MNYLGLFSFITGEADYNDENDESEEEKDNENDTDYEDDCKYGQEKLFTNLEAKTIIEYCKHIIPVGPVSKERVQRALDKCAVGKRILEKYDICQVQTRLKYERLKYKRKPKRK